MSVKRRDLIKYFEKSGFYLLREGGKESILFTQTTLKLFQSKGIKHLTE